MDANLVSAACVYRNRHQSEACTGELQSLRDMKQNFQVRLSWSPLQLVNEAMPWQEIVYRRVDILEVAGHERGDKDRVLPLDGVSVHLPL